jgi:hypothetical protein
LDDATDGDCSQDEGLSVEREQEMILQELQVSLGREMKLSTVVVQRIITAVK